MKFSEQWLRTWLKLAGSTSDLLGQLTQLGLEVESVAGDIIDIAIPPNRGDCLSIQGIARELAVLNKINLQLPKIKQISSTINNVLPVKIQDSKACPKYLGRVISGIKRDATTPAWMQTILAAAGVSSISPVVDITNYIMLELGQPMHAFDLHTIQQEIHVRMAVPNETLVLLDNTEIKLSPQNLVIADQKQALALAGIMGGSQHSVTEATTDIFLECAYFDPISIRLTSRQLGISTDASYRFERGIDPMLQEQALARATQLLQEIVGGEPGPVITVTAQQYLPTPAEILLRSDRINKILNTYPGDKAVVDILTRSGMQCNAIDIGWQVMVPSFRQDLTLEIDLIAEIARFIGYDTIPAINPYGELRLKTHPETQISEFQIKSFLRCRGFAEVITYSFISQELMQLFAPDLIPCELLNPISADLAVMRPNLFPGLINVLKYNENRQCNRMRIFEIGLKFVQQTAGEVQQQKVIAGLCAGALMQENWGANAKAHDFFDIKSDIAALANLANIQGLRYQTITDHPILHPGKAAAIFKGQQLLGIMGELHPKLVDSLGLSIPVYLFELEFNGFTNGELKKFNCISKFPGIRRDLAIIIAENILAADLLKIVQQSCGTLLQDCCIFDVYQGVGVPNGYKSIGLGLLLQHPTRTLVEEEIKQVLAELLQALQNNFQAILRTS